MDGDTFELNKIIKNHCTGTKNDSGRRLSAYNISKYI